MKLTRSSLLILFISILMFSCAHHSVPKQVPQVSIETVGNYDQIYSVNLVNDQPDTTEALYWAAGVHRWYANYNIWTQFFIDRYAEELVKRGVKVSENSPNVLKFKLSDFAVMQGFAVIRINMKIRIENSDKTWVKDWTESDTSGWSGGRDLGSAIYHAIEKLLKDPEVLNEMKSDLS